MSSISFNLGPTTYMSNPYSTQRQLISFQGFTYGAQLGQTFSASSITYQDSDAYMSLTGISADTYQYLGVGNCIVGAGIPSGSIISKIVQTNIGAGTGTYGLTMTQPANINSVDAYVAVGSIANYGQVVASAPTYATSAYSGRLDFYTGTVLSASITNGNLGIGKIAPLFALDCSGTAVVSGNLAINTTPLYNLDISGTVRLQNAGTTALSVYNGNVGIGTTLPLYPVDIRSNTSSGILNVLSTDTTKTAAQLTNSSSGSQWITSVGGVSGVAGFSIADISANSTRFHISTSGNIGLGGRTSAQYALDVSGSVGVSGNLAIGLSTGQVPKFTMDVSGTARIFTAGTNALVVAPSGNVGMNTSLPPAYTLDISGNLNYTGKLYKNAVPFTTLTHFVDNSAGLVQVNGPSTTVFMKPYVSKGGTVFITAYFSSYTTATSGYTYGLLIDGITVASRFFYFNQTTTNRTIPTFYYAGVLSAGTHQISISIPANTVVNLYNPGSIFIEEYQT